MKFQNYQNEQFFSGNMGKLEKKTLTFGGLKTKWEGGRGALKIDYRRLSMSVFFAASIPKLWNQVSDVSAQFVGSTFDHNHYSMIIIE